ncbi:MAG TPA: MarR family winged helix-turn-helix transcriptional regulator [Actinomycetales bacterium]|nr:MarR family winged helix-turn-helix transcriptional regulator [Actinomycetales bacterium]
MGEGMQEKPGGAVTGDPIVELEHELAVLLRRSRGFSAQVAKAVHPDVEPAAYALLVRLSETGGDRLTQLAAYFGVGKATVSRQLTQLHDLGLIDRVEDPDDARAQVVRLSKVGAERLEAARGARRRRFRQMLGEWEAGDLRTLAELLRRFNSLHS